MANKRWSQLFAGKGIKRVIPNENIDEEATVTKTGKQNLQFILIDWKSYEGEG